MKSYLLLLAIFLFSHTVLSQSPNGEKPDYQKIKSEITDKKRESYYPKLMDRFEKRDTTLVAADFKNLYYGYVFQKAYDPYKHSSNDDELKKFFMKDSLGTSDYEPFIKLAEKSLKETPFDLRLLSTLGYLYHMSKDDIMAKKTGYMANNLFKTIISTGDGLTCETAFHVISVDNEYSILGVFELESKGQSLSGNCDYFGFEKGRYKIDGLYFDVSKLFESMSVKN
jgi:hypothetical protein